MGFKFWDFLRPRDGTCRTVEITCREMFEAAQEYQVRELCFWICVNMIANAVGRCDFRTFRDHREIKEKEHYLWNVEPNINQNSTAFLHKLVAMLFKNGESLIIQTRPHNERDALVVADDYQLPNEYPASQNEYKGVRVGAVSYEKTFRENDVLHLRLNHCNITGVLDGMYKSYYRLIDAAQRAYTWGMGQHWKVHINQIAQGSDFKDTFAQMLEEQIKPFLDSNGAILPEFDGYQYENVGVNSSAKDTRDIRAMIEDIFDFTARSFNIPAVLVNGKIEGTADANTRFLTNCIDPICDQLTEEIIRKRYGYDRWSRGDYLKIDTSSIIHFDLLSNAAGIEKLVGSGAFTINDIRRAIGQPEISEPWANQHFMTLNISDMASATRALSPEKGGVNDE